MAKATKAKRVGKGKTGRSKKSDTSTQTNEDGTTTKEFPQVGDGIRTHRGAASGWATGQVKYVGDNGAIIATVNGSDLGLERGNYEPGDGQMPTDRHAGTPPELRTVDPIIGPPGPVLGDHPSATTFAGQTLPQGRIQPFVGTGTETDDKDLKPNAGPSMTAGPAPEEGESFAASAAGGAPPAHPPEKVVSRLKKEKQARKAVDAQTAKAARP